MDNYRTIWLLAVVGKLLAKIINTRLKLIAESFLSDDQNGFRPDRSTVQSIVSLRLIQQAAYERNIPLFVCPVDLRKGFDSLPRPLLFDVLRWLGVPPAIMSIIEQLHSDVVGKVKGCADAASFRAHRGVRQGCCLGPMMFNLAYEALINKANLDQVEGLGVHLIQTPGIDGVQIPEYDAGSTRCTNLRYADDLVLIAHTPEAITAALSRLTSILHPLGVFISDTKTKGAWLAGKPDNPGCAYLNGTELETVDKFVYLGSVFQDPSVFEGGLTSEDATNAVRRGTKALNGLRPLLRRRATPFAFKVKMVRACVIPALTYGCESWRIDESTVNRMNAFLNRTRLACLNRPWIVNGRKLTGTVLRKRCLRESFRTIVAERRLMFLASQVTLRSCYRTFHLLSASFKESKQHKRLGGRVASRYIKTVITRYRLISTAQLKTLLFLRF